MGFFDRISEGLSRSRQKFTEQMNVLLDRGPNLDDDFWDDLEETLILADMGGSAASQVVENLRDEATRKALPDAYAVLDRLNDELASTFATTEADPFGGDPACVLFVGINGAGKTTTVGKIAKEGDRCMVARLFWVPPTRSALPPSSSWRYGLSRAERAHRGAASAEADPASVCYDTIERAEADRCRSGAHRHGRDACIPPTTSCASCKRS